MGHNKVKTKENGALGFSQDYWDKNYAEPEEMDNIVNAKEHVEYLRALLALESVDVSSIVDLGFGLGILFKESLRVFKPYRALGIEPSLTAFEKVSKKVEDKKFTSIESIKLKVLNVDIKTWCLTQPKKPEIFDLGICTSVFQYLSDEDIEIVLPRLAQKVRYLYFSVPTDLELKRQVDELEFFDEYALRRSKEKYLKMIKPHFTIISNRLLESKFHFNEDSSPFTDLLFRF